MFFHCPRGRRIDIWEQKVIFILNGAVERPVAWGISGGAGRFSIKAAHGGHDKLTDDRSPPAMPFSRMIMHGSRPVNYFIAFREGAARGPRTREAGPSNGARGDAVKKTIAFVLIAVVLAASCKKKERIVEPHSVLVRWAKAIQNMDHRDYARCEAYPKSEPVFREMFRDYYYTDLMTVSVGQPDEGDVRRDYEGNPYIQVPVSFEGSVVRRSTGKPYQVVRGDAIFVKFVEGKRKAQGWLLSNRTIVTVPR